MGKKHPIILDGTLYQSIAACSEVTGIACERIIRALKHSKRISIKSKELHVEYAGKYQQKNTQKKETNHRRSGLLLPGLCTHRLGAYLGGRW